MNDRWRDDERRERPGMRPEQRDARPGNPDRGPPDARYGGGFRGEYEGEYRAQPRPDYRTDPRDFGRGDERDLRYGQDYNRGGYRPGEDDRFDTRRGAEQERLNASRSPGSGYGADPGYDNGSYRGGDGYDRRPGYQAHEHYARGGYEPERGRGPDHGSQRHEDRSWWDRTRDQVGAMFHGGEAERDPRRDDTAWNDRFSRDDRERREADQHRQQARRDPRDDRSW